MNKSVLSMSEGTPFTSVAVHVNMHAVLFYIALDVIIICKIICTE